jgi:DNA-binding IclR family transcriptional regulator
MATSPDVNRAEWPLAERKAGKTAPSGRDDRLFVEAVARAIRVLEVFSQAPTALSLARIAEAAGIDKSAAQRIAHTLTQLGYLEQASGGVMPGRRLLSRAFDYLRAEPLVSRAVPVLTELRRSVQERVDFSLFDDLHMLYLVRLQSKRETFYAHLIGRSVPTFCTSGGWAVLAKLPPERVRDVLARSDKTKVTPRTLVRTSEILRRVGQARDAGYSTAVEQIMIGEVAIGAAVLDEQGRPIAAIHVVGSLSEWKVEDFAHRAGPLAVAAANAISLS